MDRLSRRGLLKPAQEVPSGAKALRCLGNLMYGLKPVPFKKSSHAGPKGRKDDNVYAGSESPAYQSSSNALRRLGDLMDGLARTLQESSHAGPKGLKDVYAGSESPV